MPGSISHSSKEWLPDAWQYYSQSQGVSAWCLAVSVTVTRSDCLMPGTMSHSRKEWLPDAWQYQSQSQGVAA